MQKKMVFSVSVSSVVTFLLLTLCLTVGGESVYAGVQVMDTPPLSSGLTVLAARHSMNKSGLVGEELVFDPDDFARALDLFTVPAITVIQVPPVTDGELRLGSAQVKAGQTIVRGELERLAFVPSGRQISDSSFTFRIGESGYDIRCDLHYLTELNAAPTIANGMDNVVICEHLFYRGQATMQDPEGDSMRCVTVSPPAHGSLQMEDAAHGCYIYRPAKGFRGTDRFALIAVDEWGNSSAQVWIEVTVAECPMTAK